MNMDTKILNKSLANRSNNTLKGLFIMTKWDSSLGCKCGSTFTNSISVIDFIQKEKAKNHMILSIDAEKAFDKIQHPFLIKTLQSVGIEGTFLNLKKPSMKSLQRISFSMGKSWKSFP